MIFPFQTIRFHKKSSLSAATVLPPFVLRPFALPIPFLPPGFHFVAMGAQWVLNGCSMDAEYMLNPTSPG